QQFKEIFRGDGELLQRVVKGRQNRTAAVLAGQGPFETRPPRRQLALSVFRRTRLLSRQVVGNIVGVPHEGVDRAKGFALRRGQHQEGVVKIASLLAGYADTVFVRQLQVDIATDGGSRATHRGTP